MTLKERLVKSVVKMSGMTSQELVTAVWGGVSQSPRMGSAELLKAYSTMPWLRAILGRVSWSVSSVPWQLYVRTDKQSGKAVRQRSLQRNLDPRARMKMYKSMRADDTLKEITNHPALDLLDHGNPIFPGQTVTQLSQTHLDLVGQTLWVIDRSAVSMGASRHRGMPQNIWPMPPTWVTRWPSMTDPSYLFATPRGSLTVHQDDVIDFRHPSPDDPYIKNSGLGHAMADELETDEYAAKHMKNWFKNFARPDVIITADGLNKGEIQKVEDTWLKKLTMQNNKPIFMNRKLEVHELSQTFKDMELSKLRKDERDIFIHVIGMPPEILGIIENSNRSTIDAADYLFAKYVTVPRLEFFRIMLQIHLIEHYDERLILDYVSPVLGDNEFELKVRTVAPWSSTVDEWREMSGLAPLADDKGKIYVVPFNMTAVTDLTELSDKTEPKPGTTTDEEGDDDE